jgi:uncharacterized phage protein gp47/JayE
MTTNSTPARMVVPTREQQIASYKRDYGLRDPNANVVTLEQVDVDARVLTDQLLPIMAQARSAGDALTYLNQSGDDLDNTWAPRGLPRLLANGASGPVQISASEGGGPIFKDDELKDLNTGFRYKCLATNLSYQDGDPVPVVGIDVGPQTDVAPGTRLTWSRNRPGIGPTAVVLDQGDGTGLSGGRSREQDDSYKQRIADFTANPPAAGNPAEVVNKTEKAGVAPVEKAFAYPAILGSDTTGVVFLLKPSKPGANRIPSEIQRAAVEGIVVGQFPGGENYVFPTVLGEAYDLAIQIRWVSGAGWKDLVPWPPEADQGAGRIVVSGTPTSATAFVLRTDDDDYTGVPAPQVNKSLAFYDAERRKFSRKTIATVTGTGPWTITCSTTLGASDTAYTPTTGQACCPWAEALDATIEPILLAFDRLGPGEMVENADFLLDGQRQRRFPSIDSADWPSSIGPLDFVDLKQVPQIANLGSVTFSKVGGVFENDVISPTVGTPGVTAYLLKVGNISLFPA